MSELEGAKIAIAPFPSVRSGAVAIEFYKAAFGAVELFRHDGYERNGSAAGGSVYVLAPESVPQRLKPRIIRIAVARLKPCP